MGDRPMIFSAAMIQALLAGRKSQTRRLIKGEVPPSPRFDSVNPRNIELGKKLHPAPYLDSYCGNRKTAANPRGMSDRWCWWTRDDRQDLPTFKVPYVPGDRLWVRETFALVGGADPGFRLYRAGGYEAQCDRYGFDKPYPPESAVKWRSPIFMPRTLSRLTLIVENVRVQRLWEISDDEAVAEGVRKQRFVDWYSVPGVDGAGTSPRAAFALLWNTVHGNGAWNANPWVCAISFVTIPANIDTMEAKAA